MFIAGTNLTISYFAFHLRFDKIYKNEEFRYYLGFILGFTIFFTLTVLLLMDRPLENAFRDSLFQVVSIMTTTGFITSDYLKWAPVLWILIIVLMFFGGSSGSTSSSVKIMRIMLLIKNSILELRRIAHPNAIIPVRFNNQAVHPEIITNVLAFVLFYLLTVVAGMVVMSALGYDLDTSLGAVVATLGNIGPGIGAVGPADNYSNIIPAGKWFLTFLMLIGRLELFTVLVMFTPVFWRK
jgi:trk system potassium uptake protein TrkH